MTAIVTLCYLLAGALPQPDTVLDRPVPRLSTATKFRAELERLLTLSWQNVPLRTIIRRISENQSIAILLDRRIDPTQRVAVELNGESLLVGLQTIAAGAGAQVSIVGNTVCLGPAKSISKLRTLVVLRSNELLRQASSLPKGRLRELSQKHTLHWNDLDRPADLVRRVAVRYQLQVSGLDKIQHDLWAGTTLPSLSAVEVLSVLLIQFDLTFRWTDGATGLQIIPIPARVAIERSYTPRGSRAETAVKTWSKKWPGIRAEAKGRRVVVAWSGAQQAAIAALLRPSRKRPDRPSKSPKPTPLDKLDFGILKFERLPAIGLIRRLEKDGIVFKYDDKQLAAAGIDLNTPISMDLKDATADDVFRALCKPLGLKFSTAGLTVTLSPK